MAEGCHGGWGYFDSLFLEQYGAVEKSCGHEYQGSLSAGGCSTWSDCKAVAGVEDTYYVGRDFYGGMSEEDMVKEVRTRGPILFDFNAGISFQMYESGIINDEGINAVEEQFVQTLAQSNLSTDGENKTDAATASETTQED